MDVDARKVGGIAALASAGSGFAGVGAALAMSPWFSWSSSALSDLGHPSRSSALAFNTGLLVSGLLFVVMAAALFQSNHGRGTRSAAAVLGGGGLSLASIGVITEAWGFTHFVVSFAYFTLVPLGMLLLARASPSRRVFRRLTWGASLGSWTFGISILTAIAFRFPFTSQAVPELLASLINGAWVVAVGLELLRAPPDAPTPEPHPSP